MGHTTPKGQLLSFGTHFLQPRNVVKTGVYEALCKENEPIIEFSVGYTTTVICTAHTHCVQPGGKGRNQASKGMCAAFK